MFTGIIQSVCSVRSAVPGQDGRLLEIDMPLLAEDVALGDSVCVNGLCLTAVKIAASVVSFDVSPESVARSTISTFKAGTKVNVELAMKPTDRFGGHIVQGHVDGIAKLQKIQNMGRFLEVTYSASKNLMRDMVTKGSVAVDGISLTIAKLDATGFTVAVVPLTWEKTNMAQTKTGQDVNIETDIVCKMISKRVSELITDKSPLDMEKLQQWGY
jgi:riboflavin synthase